MHYWPKVHKISIFDDAVVCRWIGQICTSLALNFSHLYMGREFWKGGYLLGDTVFTNGTISFNLCKIPPTCQGINVVMSPIPIPPLNAHVWSWDRWMMLSLFKSLIGCSFVADLIEKSIHKKPHFCRRGKRKSRISIVKKSACALAFLNWKRTIFSNFVLILQFGNYK